MNTVAGDSDIYWFIVITIHAYIHSYILYSIHTCTCIHTYIHTYIHLLFKNHIYVIHTYIHTYILRCNIKKHTCIRTCINQSMHVLLTQQ